MLRLLSTITVTATIALAPTTVTAQPNSPARAAPTGTAPGPGASDLVTITLRDGQLLRGVVVAETAEHIIITLVSGGEVVVEHAQIRSLKRNDKSVFVGGNNEIYKHDPNRTRYLYSPSAFMLRKGEGYFSQTELFASTLGFGVTDNLTVTVGSVLPALFTDGGANFILGARVGGSLSEMVHISGGANSIVIPNFGLVGIASGQFTVGTPRAHFTLSAGKPFLIEQDDDSELGPILFTVSGNLRVSKHLAIITENWLIPGDNENTILSGAARFMGEHIAVDVGFLVVEDGTIPIPWLDFTWNWD